MKNAGITRVCITCGTAFHVPPSRAKAKYCQMSCYVGRPVKHGWSHTRLYRVWIGMKVRCTNPNHRHYDCYGGRWIKVSDEWLNSFHCFRDWALSNGYTIGLEIDRRDTNGNYSPENCRWVTRTQNNRNTRKKKSGKSSRFKGVMFNRISRKWRAAIKENGRTNYLGEFTSEEEAARVYDAAAIRVFGEFAHCNFQYDRGVPSVT